MADFAPNFTVRYKITYTTGGHNHTAQVRAARGSGAAGALGARDRLMACVNALSTLRYTDWTLLKGEYSIEDTDFFNPDPTIAGATAGTVVIPANPKSQGILSTGFVGKSILGAKARLFLYGVDLSPETSVASADDFRLLATQSAPVAAAIAALSAGVGLVGSDNGGINWYSYVNLKYNDYWLKRIRA